MTLSGTFLTEAVMQIKGADASKNKPAGAHPSAKAG
jgi:hypothetical protein